MPSLKDLRNRIASTKATQKITKAMQMVAASKLRRAQAAAEAARPYAQHMDKVLGNIARGVVGLEWAPKLLAGTGRQQAHLLVVCTAARVLKFEHAQPIAEKLTRLFAEGAFDVCTLFFSRFKSVIAQIPTAQQIIPPLLPAQEADNAGGAVYEYEPDEEDILAELLPLNIAVQVFRALLENTASEQGARMSAMDNATRNAGDMIERQTMSYNRSRQAMITKELIEIISGAEAL